MGCDLEKIGPFKEKVAGRFFCPEEYEVIMQERTEEEKAEQLAAIENDPEYIQLQADLAELELRIAALNTSWEQAAEDARRWRETLEQLKEQIRRLEDDSEVASIADEVTAGVITMADGVTQLLSANVQLDSALTQLEQGLRTLESSRASALEQADLSGASEHPDHHRPADGSELLHACRVSAGGRREL